MTTSMRGQPTFDPSDFEPGQEIDNQFLPYHPGTTFVYHTFDEQNELTEISTVRVTDGTRVVDGVECIVVLDVVRDAETGLLIEKTFDYYAQDESDNVWYFGEVSRQYEDGVLVGTEGSWLAGVDGATPGIVMEAHPRVSDRYNQENAPGVAEDRARVVSFDGEVNVPFGQFDDCLVTHETSPLDRQLNENKFYAEGIGQVLVKDRITGEQDKLISVTTDGRIVRLTDAIASFGADQAHHASPANTTTTDQGTQQLIAALTSG